MKSAGGATGCPPITPQRGTAFEIEGHADTTTAQRFAYAYFIAASTDYFKTLGTRLVRGREFSASDAETAPKVVVVSRELAGGSSRTATRWAGGCGSSTRSNRTTGEPSWAWWTTSTTEAWTMGIDRGCTRRVRKRRFRGSTSRCARGENPADWSGRFAVS